MSVPEGGCSFGFAEHISHEWGQRWMRKRSTGIGDWFVSSNDTCTTTSIGFYILTHGGGRSFGNRKGFGPLRHVGKVKVLIVGFGQDV